MVANNHISELWNFAVCEYFSNYVCLLCRVIGKGDFGYPLPPLDRHATCFHFRKCNNPCGVCVHWPVTDCTRRSPLCQPSTLEVDLPTHEMPFIDSQEFRCSGANVVLSWLHWVKGRGGYSAWVWPGVCPDNLACSRVKLYFLSSFLPGIHTSMKKSSSVS